LSGRIHGHIRSNVVGYVALFLVLTGGTAYALDGSNTVFTDDIVNGEVTNADIAAGAVDGTKVLNGSITGPEVQNDSLTGLDINEATLGEVPNSAALGGKSLSRLENIGASSVNTNGCDPANTASLTCASQSVTSPAGSRFLVNASGSWFGIDNDLGADNNRSSAGTCRLAQSGFQNTDIAFGGAVRLGQFDNRHNNSSRGDGFALTAVVSSVVDNPAFKVKCTQTDADFKAQDVQISVVRLSS
jgi:hypothetical protein